MTPAVPAKMFATIAGPDGHRVARYLVDGRIACQCKAVLADRSQLAAHLKLEGAIAGGSL